MSMTSTASKAGGTIERNQQSPSPTNSNEEWSTSASPPELIHPTADEQISDKQGTSATPVNGIRPADGQGYTILVPANVRFQGMNVQIDLKLDQHPLSDSITKAVNKQRINQSIDSPTSQSNSMNGNMNNGRYSSLNGQTVTERDSPLGQTVTERDSPLGQTNDYSSTCRTPPITSAASHANSSTHNNSHVSSNNLDNQPNGTVDNNSNDGYNNTTNTNNSNNPPLPCLSMNMRRKTGGRSPRDLLAEKLKKAANQQAIMGSNNTQHNGTLTNGDLQFHSQQDNTHITSKPMSPLVNAEEFLATVNCSSSPNYASSSASITSVTACGNKQPQYTNKHSSTRGKGTGEVVSVLGRTGSGGYVQVQTQPLGLSTTAATATMTRGLMLHQSPMHCAQLGHHFQPNDSNHLPVAASNSPHMHLAQSVTVSDKNTSGAAVLNTALLLGSAAESCSLSSASDTLNGVANAHNNMNTHSHTRTQHNTMVMGDSPASSVMSSATSPLSASFNTNTSGASLANTPSAMAANVNVILGPHDTPMHHGASTSASGSGQPSPCVQGACEPVSEVSHSAQHSPVIRTGNSKQQRSRSKGETGQQCEFVDPDKPCRQRAICGYKYCIRHILNDPAAPYKPCAHMKKMKKKSDKEINCSNPVRADQDLPYCSTHLIVLGIKEPKRKPGSTAPTPDVMSPANNTDQSAIAQGQSTQRQQSAHGQHGMNNMMLVGPPSSADLPSDLLNLDNAVQENLLAINNGMAGGMEALPSPTVHNQRVPQPPPGEWMLPDTSQHSNVASQQQTNAISTYNNTNSNPRLVVTNNTHNNSSNAFYQQPGPYAPQHRANLNGNGQLLAPPPSQSSAGGESQSINPLAILNSLQSPLPSPSAYQNSSHVINQSPQHSQSHSSLGTHASGFAQPAPSVDQNTLWQNNNGPPSYGPSQHPPQQPVYYGPDGSQMPHTPLQQRSISAASAPSSRPGSQLSAPATNTNTYGPPSSQQSFYESPVSSNGNGGLLSQSMNASNSAQMVDWQQHRQSAPPTNQNMLLHAPPHSPRTQALAQTHNGTSMLSPNQTFNPSDLVQSYPELAAKLGGQGQRLVSGANTVQLSRTQSVGNPQHIQPTQLTTLQPLQYRPSQQQPNARSAVTALSTLDDDAGHDGPFLRPESSTCCLSSVPSSSTTTPNQNSMMHTPNKMVQHMTNLRPPVNDPSALVQSSQGSQAMWSASPNKPTLAALNASGSAVLGMPQQRAPKFYRAYCAAAVIARLQQKRTQQQMNGTSRPVAGAGVVESVIKPGGEKVIRLRQKQRRMPLVGKYNNIPMVQQMCMVLEDRDFDRTDLFPLGLEPSDSDTDSEEDECSVGSRQLEQHFTAHLIDPVGHKLQTQHTAHTFKSRQQSTLYLVKKQLRLERHRLNRAAWFNKGIMDAARRYPNSVGQALVDRQSQVGMGGRAHSRSRLKWKQLMRAVKQKGDAPLNSRSGNAVRRAPQTQMPPLHTQSVRSHPVHSRDLRVCRQRPGRTRLLTQRCCVFKASPTNTVATSCILHCKDCHAPRMPSCNHCAKHVLHNTDQLLFRYCAQPECNRPVLPINLSDNQSHSFNTSDSHNTSNAHVFSMCSLHQHVHVDDNMLNQNNTHTNTAIKRYPSQKTKKRRRPQTQHIKQEMNSEDMKNTILHSLHPETHLAHDELGEDDDDMMGHSMLSAHSKEDVSLASVAKEFGFEDDQELTDILNQIQPDVAFSNIIAADFCTGAASASGASSSMPSSLVVSSGAGGLLCNPANQSVTGPNTTRSTSLLDHAPASSSQPNNFPLPSLLPASMLIDGNSPAAPVTSHQSLQPAAHVLLPPSNQHMNSGLPPFAHPPGMDVAAGGHSWADIEQFLLSEGYRTNNQNNTNNASQQSALLTAVTGAGAGAESMSVLQAPPPYNHTQPVQWLQQTNTTLLHSREDTVAH